LRLVLASLWITTGIAQTSDELQARHGKAENGAYAISSDARLTVSYGDDARACRLILIPRDEEKGFQPAVADRVLNDIAPVSVRKGKPHSFVEQMSCAAKSMDAYSNVAITRVTDKCKHSVQLLTIEWIRSSCGNCKH
jgi:hypothetical protein